MDRQEIEQKVRKILSDKLRVSGEKITDEASLRDDLGMDSFGGVEVIFELEDVFNIDVPPEDIPDIHTFKDMVDSIVRLTGK